LLSQINRLAADLQQITETHTMPNAMTEAIPEIGIYFAAEWGPNDVDDSTLSYWFLHDSWTSEEAFLLIAGLDPNQTEFAKADPFRIESTYRLDVKYLARDARFGPDSGKGELEAAEYFCRQIRALWKSGVHEDRNPPTYFIEWAKSKRIHIPWRGIVGQNKSSNTSERESHDTSRSDHRRTPQETRHRNTLLVIVAALCKAAKVDFAAPGGARNVAALTEAAGTVVDEDTVRKILREIPQAIERRLK
jgi:hypothetical protein